VRLKQVSLPLLSVLTVLLLSVPAIALIENKWPISKVYGETKILLVGKVTAVAQDTRVIDVAITEAVKGKSPGEKIRIKIATPAELIKEIAVDQPVLLFIMESDGSVAAVHVADTWLNATAFPNSKLLGWGVVQLYKEGGQAYPGRTSALVKIVAELKAGKTPLLEKFERKAFAGGVKPRGKLAGIQKPAWIMAADIDGDKKPDLIVGSAADTRLFLAKGDSYEDATAAWGSWPAAVYHACGDVNGDGKIDLLLDDTLLLNQGGKFTPVKLGFDAKQKPFAAALLDVNGDQKPDALFLSATGELRVYENPGDPAKLWNARPPKQLWTDPEPPIFAAFGDFGDNGKVHVVVVSKAGIVRYPVDADGGPPADLKRLTGSVLSKNEKYKDGLKNPWGAALHMSDSPRPDLFVSTDAGSLLLVSRGFGAFLMDENAAPDIRTANPNLRGPATAADIRGRGVDDLLVIGDDGALYEIDN
jgi:hypothetical protein